MVNRQDRLNQVFTALSDPTRRSILMGLLDGEKTVSELSQPFDISPPAISKHLRLLEGAGLLKQTKCGRHRQCRLIPQPLREAATWIDRYRQMWEVSLDSFADYAADLERSRTKRGRHK